MCKTDDVLCFSLTTFFFFFDNYFQGQIFILGNLVIK